MADTEQAHIRVTDRELWINGVDIARYVESWGLSWSADDHQAPQLRVVLTPGVVPQFDGQGVVEVLTDLETFLDRIDPEQLTEDTLSRQTEAMAPTSFGEAVLDVMKGYARGD